MSLPTDPIGWRYDGKDISRIFADASGGDIALQLESKLDRELSAAAAQSSSLDLHQALAALTGNRTDRGPVDRIGVIFAGSYQERNEMLGLMFDRGFVAPDDRNSSFMAVPREGCAVFVDAIRNLRKGDATQIEHELKFTTVHELGHVFNLEHIEDAREPDNFMRTSDEDAPFDSGYYRFTQKHRTYLGKCSQFECIHPGGTRYGDRKALGDSFDPLQVGNFVASPAAGDLQLKIACTQDSFWYCEPVELEVTLLLPRRARCGLRFLDRIDPGYPEFSICISEPNGERRYHRSPKFFCALPSHRKILPGENFRRDISIFGQSGGYTFQRPGLHRLTAILRLSRKRTLTSNQLVLELRPRSAGKRDFTRVEPLLRRRARLLYYRAARNLSLARNDVNAIRAIWPRSATAAACLYALGRAHASRATRAQNRDARRHAKLAVEFLENATQEELGRHSTARAIDWIKTLKGQHDLS